MPEDVTVHIASRLPPLTGLTMAYSNANLKIGGDKSYYQDRSVNTV
jgi:hypothetical protein